MEQLAPLDGRGAQRAEHPCGHSHERAAMIGPSVTCRSPRAELCIGHVPTDRCIAFDDRPRQARLVVKVLGV